MYLFPNSDENFINQDYEFLKLQNQVTDFKDSVSSLFLITTKLFSI